MKKGMVILPFPNPTKSRIRLQEPTSGQEPHPLGESDRWASVGFFSRILRHLRLSYYFSISILGFWEDYHIFLLLLIIFVF